MSVIFIFDVNNSLLRIPVKTLHLLGTNSPNVTGRPQKECAFTQRKIPVLPEGQTYSEAEVCSVEHRQKGKQG